MNIYKPTNYLHWLFYFREVLVLCVALLWLGLLLGEHPEEEILFLVRIERGRDEDVSTRI